MSEELKYKFLNPEDEYSPIPFWFWNDNLNEYEITKQINDFYEKGVRGFVIHPRIGIPKEIEYLSDQFMGYVKYAVEQADSLGMKVVLYDEAMYPSGSAHGMVVKSNPDYASKALKMTEYKCNGSLSIPLNELDSDKLVSIMAVKKIDEKEIVPESITKLLIEEQGILFSPKDEEEWSVLVFTETFSGGTIRGIHFGEDDGELNAPAAGDLLNKKAMEEFIKLTHDRYYEVLKNYFGNTVIGMFTDEPSLLGRGGTADLKPRSGDFLEYYMECGNHEKDLPLLWFEAKDLSYGIRKRYEAAINKRMEETYYKPIYNWCNDHGIALTGHPHNSDDIGFLKYFHIPAQDVVWRWVAPENRLALNGQHSTMAKCSSDSARHRGIRRNGNECFACCGREGVEWSFSADDMKWYMDWLFVRGVNLLYPHAFFYSIDGERRIGERPPDVGPNNIWWPYYNQISNYMKRMSYLLTDSVNCAKTAVLCEGHHLPFQIVKPMYENQIEFNYLEKELFVSDVCVIKDSFITIAKQSYTLLVIEDIDLIDEVTAEKIIEFAGHGGKIVIYSGNGTYGDAAGMQGINNVVFIDSFSHIIDIADACNIRDIKCENAENNLRMSHLIKDGYEFFVFVNEGEEEIHTKTRIYAVGTIEKWNPWEGIIYREDQITDIKDSYMDIDLHIARRESLILFIDTKVPPQIYDKNEKYRIREVKPHNKWEIKFPSIETMQLDHLISWNMLDNMKYYSGSAFYSNQFFIENPEAVYKAELNLGEVYEITDIKINNTAAGVLMWSPYKIDITNFLIKGENKIELEVKNTLANHICKKSYPSGLLGPVRINLYIK